MPIQYRPETSADTRRLYIAFSAALTFVLLLWLLKLVEYVSGIDFAQFGIYPRRAAGLAGILLAPFIHGSATHLFANTLPIIIMGTMLLYAYPRAAKVLLPAVYIGGGIAVWLFAREAYHIGASGLAFGLLFFVLTIGIIRWEHRTIALSLVVFFLYGGMISGVLPMAHDISFESHLSGALIGLILAFPLRHRDPASPRKQYSWELEETEVDENDQPDRNVKMMEHRARIQLEKSLNQNTQGYIPGSLCSCKTLYGKRLNGQITFSIDDELRENLPDHR